MTSSDQGEGAAINITGETQVGAFTSEGRISISRKQALEGITSDIDKDDSAKDEKVQDGKPERIDVDKRIESEGRKQYFSLRRRWSCCIIVWITALIIFNIALTGMVGWGWLRFEDMQWFITAITV